ncbi:MAG: ParA family protein [Verrucomicrobia bacterium]|nr:ParA family protein [Verrucomicrobiota bacterium]
MNTVTFFNNKGGVGKTSLVYHLAWMYSELGLKVLAVDFDPQANLSAMFLEEEVLEQMWPEGEHAQTVLGAVRPIIRGVGDLMEPHIELVSRNLGLLIGDLGLSSFEDELSAQWPECNDGKERAFRVISTFYRLMLSASEKARTDLVLVDVGPNLGAINRAALIATDHVVIPLAPDLFSMQGLRNLGPTLRRWRRGWGERLNKNPDPKLPLPSGAMKPGGYVFMQHFAREKRPVKAFDRWMQRMPSEYRVSVLDEKDDGSVKLEADPHCLAKLKHYRSLMPMAMEARRPMFDLRPADGAIGAHTYAVQECKRDFEELARKIAASCGIPVPSPGTKSHNTPMFHLT